jgi:hypothetical protein
MRFILGEVKAKKQALSLNEKISRRNQSCFGTGLRQKKALRRDFFKDLNYVISGRPRNKIPRGFARN